MSTSLPHDVQQLVDVQLATGKFATADAVLREAMQLLVDHQETREDLEASLADIDAERILPLADAAAEIRRRHGWAAR